MIYRSNRVNAFEFVVVAALRTKQLVRGVTPRVDGDHKPFITAQREVLAGKVWKIGGQPMSEQSDGLTLSKPRPAAENVEGPLPYSEDVSAAVFAGTFAK